MKLVILHMLTILISLIACEPQWEEPFKVYKIEKGAYAPKVSSMHHDNSARFGWRWLENQLEIHAHCYVDSKRVTELLGIVNLHEKANYALQVTSSKYIFQINDEEPLFIDRGNLYDIGIFYIHTLGEMKLLSMISLYKFKHYID